MPVQMQLSRIIRSEISDQQFICLRESEGPREFSIVIVEFEAKSIEAGVKRVGLSLAVIAGVVGMGTWMQSAVNSRSLATESLVRSLSDSSVSNGRLLLRDTTFCGSRRAPGG